METLLKRATPGSKASQDYRKKIEALKRVKENTEFMADAARPKVQQKYIITHVNPRGIRHSSRPLTVADAVEYYSYTLEAGASWQHERGNKKINRNPKNINSLINNLTNSVNNSAANGYGGYYEVEPASYGREGSDDSNPAPRGGDW